MIHVKIDALCEQQWLHPGKKSGHMLQLPFHQAPLRTVCLQEDSSHVPLARLRLTPQHCQARLLWCRERAEWRVKCCYVIFSDERFCLYASDALTHLRC